MTAKYYGWNIDKIYIYPYGGYSKFNEDINRPLKEEFMILLMGPVFQIIYYFIFKNIFISDFTVFHYSILLFNLLPIYPLDGGKLINIMFSCKFSYLNSFKITMIISYVVLLFIGVNFYDKLNSLNMAMIGLLVLFKLIEEHRKIGYYFNKFLLERYLKKYNFKKNKTIKNIDNMIRDTKHIIKEKNIYYTEKEYLTKRYNIRK